MTNKPMLSVKKFIHEINYDGGEMVEVDKLPEFCGSELYVLDSDYQSLQEQLEELRSLLDKPAGCGACRGAGKVLISTVCGHVHKTCGDCKPAAQHQGDPVFMKPQYSSLPGLKIVCEEGEIGAEAFYRAPTDQPAPVAVGLTDKQILAAMREHIYAADGGYVFDTAKESVVASGRALLEVYRLNGMKP